MKISSERDPSLHPANKSRLPLTVMVVSALIVSVVLSVFWRNQRTMSGWKRYQSEIAARGESLDWKDYIPPSAPPDDENFGATPLLQAIGRKGKVDPLAWGRINGTGFAGISALIGQAVVQRGWVRQEDLVHYGPLRLARAD